MNDNIKAINDAVCKVLTERTDITYIPCLSYPIATALDALGYRKQSDTVKEFAEKVKDVLDRKIRDHGTTNIHTLRTQSERLRIAYMCIDEIAASFGGEDNDGQK